MSNQSQAIAARSQAIVDNALEKVLPVIESASAQLHTIEEYNSFVEQLYNKIK